MRTVKRILERDGKIRFAKQRLSSGRNLWGILFVLFSAQVFGQNGTQVISISGTQFTYPLLNRWISEYEKINPELSFRLLIDQENSDADLITISHSPGKEEIAGNKMVVKVGRYVVLPIANENNLLFSRVLKKGVKQEELKTIFMRDDRGWDTEGVKRKEPEYTVYTKTPQSSIAKVISSYLGKPAEDLHGVFVTGEDQYLITSVLNDSTGISYNNLSLIYDLDNRVPIKGIKILPIDLNNNGRLEKEEQIYNNLDQTIAFLEEAGKIAIPTDYVSFVTDGKFSNPEVLNFLSWVKEYGQLFNHQYGFLSNGVIKNVAITQK